MYEKVSIGHRKMALVDSFYILPLYIFCGISLILDRH
jgi:hypothetical protein